MVPYSNPILTYVRHHAGFIKHTSFTLNHRRQVLDAGFISIVDPDNNDSVSKSELIAAQAAAEKIVEASLPLSIL